MACHGCARSFGFFASEHGCSKCGYAFCSKCLTNKNCKSCSATTASTAIKSTTMGVQSNNPHTNNINKSIDGVVLQEQLLEKLEVPRKAPVIVYTENTRLSNLKRGMSAEDQELVNRLSKLKSEIREMRNVPSQNEIEERLARLKGIDPEVYKKPAVFNQQPRSNVDSATDLINQVREEISIDNQLDLPESSYIPVDNSEADGEDDVEKLLQKEAKLIESEARLALEGLAKDKEIQERLKKLKLSKEASQNDNTPIVSDSDDEEDQAAAIVKRVLAEQKLDLDNDDGGVKDAGEELPWCELCNEDAQLRCIGCDGDLFCRRCWKETHKDTELKQHRIENYNDKKALF